MRSLWPALPVVLFLASGCTDPLAGDWFSFGASPNVGRYELELDADLVGRVDFSDRGPLGVARLQGAVEGVRVDREDGVWSYDLRGDGEVAVTCALVRTTDELFCSWGSVDIAFDEGPPPEGPACHDVCEVGGPMTASCGDCVSDVCAEDPYCCDGVWDEACTNTASIACSAITCGL